MRGGYYEYNSQYIEQIPISSKIKYQNEIELASKKEKDALLKEVNKTINKFRLLTNEKKEIQKIIWKKILNKSFLTKREMFNLLGFFKKIK